MQDVGVGRMWGRESGSTERENMEETWAKKCASEYVASV